MCLFVCISVSFHGIFLKIHMSNFTCMHYKQYLGVHWRDFPETRYSAIVHACVIKRVCMMFDINLRKVPQMEVDTEES